MKYLENYYAHYDEGRLASKHGQVEFLTAMKYIHEFSQQIVGHII